MSPEEQNAAHDRSSNNREELVRSEICGCFYCVATFSPSLIKEWITERSGEQTAVCPRCGIDSVIGDASGFPITTGFLTEMRDHWFGPD